MLIRCCRSHSIEESGFDISEPGWSVAVEGRHEPRNRSFECQGHRRSHPCAGSETKRQGSPVLSRSHRSAWAGGIARRHAARRGRRRRPRTADARRGRRNLCGSRCISRDGLSDACVRNRDDHVCAPRRRGRADAQGHLGRQAPEYASVQRSGIAQPLLGARERARRNRHYTLSKAARPDCRCRVHGTVSGCAPMRRRR